MTDRVCCCKTLAADHREGSYLRMHMVQANAIKNTSLLAELHAERMARQAAQQASQQAEADGAVGSPAATPTVSVLTYNVW